MKFAPESATQHGSMNALGPFPGAEEEMTDDIAENFQLLASITERAQFPGSDHACAFLREYENIAMQEKELDCKNLGQSEFFQSHAYIAESGCSNEDKCSAYSQGEADQD